jgi:hypothetical protein
MLPTDFAATAAASMEVSKPGSLQAIDNGNVVVLVSLTHRPVRYRTQTSSVDHVIAVKLGAIG